MPSTLNNEDLCKALPRPIAFDWAATLNAGSPIASARAAEQTLITTLRLLFALQVASLGPRGRSKAFSKAVTYLEKPGLGSYGELVLALARADAPEGSFALRLAEHLRPNAEGDQRQALVALGKLRNQRAHGDLEVALDPDGCQRFVHDVRAFLVGLRWLADWQLWLVRDARVEGERSHKGSYSLLHGTDMPLVKQGAWRAPLRDNQVYLRSPDGAVFWQLEPLVVAKASVEAIRLWLPDRIEDGTLVLLASGHPQRETIPLAGDHADALLALGREPLQSEPLPSGHVPATPTFPARASAALTPGGAEPLSSRSPSRAPRMVAAGVVLAATAWVGVELAPSLAAGSGGWPWLGLGKGEVPPPLQELPTFAAGGGLADADGAPMPAAVTADIAPPLVGEAGADPLAALRDLQARCGNAASPPGEPDVVAVAAALDALEPRDATHASELDAALDLSRACDRAVVAGIATFLRQRPEQSVATVERALQLQRRLIDKSQGRERHLAALTALDDLNHLVGLEEAALDARLGDPAIEQRVSALLGLGRTLVCALAPQAAAGVDAIAGLEPNWLLRIDQSAGSAAADNPTAISERRCLAAVLSAAAAVAVAGGPAGARPSPLPVSAPLHVAAARRHLEATPCCGAQRPGCGDAVVACDALQGSVATALSLCRDAAVEPTSRRAACELALSHAERRLQARSSLSASDPRCLPPWLAPATAAARLQQLRRDTPVPTAAWPDGSLPTSPADADLEAYVAATEALAASGTEAKAVAAANLAIARMFAAHRLVPVKRGECRVATEADAEQRLRKRWQQLEVAVDLALVAEAQAIGCRLEAVEGDAAALQTRRAASACPP